MTLTRAPIEPVPPLVSVATASWGWMSRLFTSSDAASTSLETGTGRAYYFPISVPTLTFVRRVFWVNGTNTAGANTIEVGVYRDTGAGVPGAKVVSGSATQGTASQVQFVDVTDTALTPGLYWIALSASNTNSTTLFAWAGTFAQWPRELIGFQEASANPLPSTATPAERANGNVYWFGFATTASP